MLLIFTLEIVQVLSQILLCVQTLFMVNLSPPVILCTGIIDGLHDFVCAARTRQILW